MALRVFIRHSHDQEDLRNALEEIHMMEILFTKIVLIQKSENVCNRIIYQTTCQINADQVSMSKGKI